MYKRQVEIPYVKGLLGHSDADVLLHAVMDALLGAAAAGDIGKHFPDSDPKYKGISSMRLLEYVKELLDEKCYYVHNIDATIIAQKPKLAPFLPEMVKNICSILEISKNQVNIKATTEEGLGFTGQGQGIAAHAVCTLEEIDNYFYCLLYTSIGFRGIEDLYGVYGIWRCEERTAYMDHRGRELP